MEWLTYLLKVTACTVLFFGFYVVVLRKLTFFKINRFYLLATLLLSFVIPALQFEVKREITVVETEIPANVPELKPVSLAPAQLIQPVMLEYDQKAEANMDWSMLISYAYAGIASLLLLSCLWRLFSLLRHTKGSVKNKEGLKLVPKTKGFTNCSFFSYVFIDADQLSDVDFAVLLKHEQVHARQYHSVDKIILMVFKSLLWFNPIVYLYDKALEQVHEYEADEITSADFGNQAYASLLLKLAVSKSDIPLIHNFVKSPVKDRIKMLFNQKTASMKKLSYLLALPVGLLLIWGFTIKVTPVFLEEKMQEKTFTLVIDATHGGADQGAIVGDKKEKELTLAIAKEIKIAAEAKGLKVILTHTANQNPNIEERAAVNGDFLISLQLGADMDTAKNGLKFLTSGTYERDFKLPKANSMTYYIYKSIKNIEGINVSNKPQSTKNVLIDGSAKPGIVIVLGYLTNKSDFNFITDNGKQTLLAGKTVEGIMQYKKYTPSDEVRAARQKEADSFGRRYEAWLMSEKYSTLKIKAAKIGKRTISGKIESLHSFGMVSPRVDGFILNAKGTKYRVYINPAIMKRTAYKAGDDFVAKINKAEVWFDSDYLVLQPDVKTLEIKTDGAMLNKAVVPRIISFSKITGNAKQKISIMENAEIDINNNKLKAKYVELDEINGTMVAKNASFTNSKDNYRLESNLITFNLKKGGFSFDSGNGEMKTFNDLDELISSISRKDYNDDVKVHYSAQDSVKMSRDKSVVSLFGNAKMIYKDVVLSGDKIVYNKHNNSVMVHKATMSGENMVIKADSLFFNLTTAKTRLYGAGSKH